MTLPRTIILAGLMAATALVAGACSSGGEDAATEAETVSSMPKRAIEAAQAVTLANPTPNEDPVCHMKLGAEYETVEYETKMYGLCSTGCVKKFEADPDRYLTVASNP